MNLGRLRKPVDTYAPRLGRLYRGMRDRTTAHKSRPTVYGFRLAGDPLMAKDDWEPSEVREFLKLLQSHDVVVDVGANVGLYTCLAASQSKQVISFEPLQRNVKYLTQNLWENSYLDVEVYPHGLSSQPGLKPIYGMGGIASFIPGWGQADAKRSEIIPVTTLDNVLNIRFRDERLLIKVDVEGYEFEVLAGSGETLRRQPRPTWLIEILLAHSLIPGGTNHQFQATFELFWELGYECKTLDGSDAPVNRTLVEQWRARGSVPSNNINFLFSHSDS